MSNSSTVRRSHAEVVVKNSMVAEKLIHRMEETVKRKTNASFLVQFCAWGGLEYLPLFARISSRGVSSKKYFAWEALYRGSGNLLQAESNG